MGIDGQILQTKTWIQKYLSLIMFIAGFLCSILFMKCSGNVIDGFFKPKVPQTPISKFSDIDTTIKFKKEIVHDTIKAIKKVFLPSEIKTVKDTNLVKKLQDERDSLQILLNRKNVKEIYSGEIIFPESKDTASTNFDLGKKAFFDWSLKKAPLKVVTKTEFVYLPAKEIPWYEKPVIVAPAAGLAGFILRMLFYK
jgi:hypothetical protein